MVERIGMGLRIRMQVKRTGPRNKPALKIRTVKTARRYQCKHHKPEIVAYPTLAQYM